MNANKFDDNSSVSILDCRNKYFAGQMKNPNYILKVKDSNKHNK